MSVYKKLHQLQAATRSLAANAAGQTGSARYNYVSGAKLLDQIRPHMDKLGLILTQEVVDIKNEPITYSTRNGDKTEMFTTAHIRFTWVDVEDESKIVNDFFANGMNAWDKGLGSALTYAERYYLMKTFHIATDEDDVDALVKDEAIEQPKPKKTTKAEPKKEAKPAATTEVKRISDTDAEAIEALANWAYQSAERIARARDSYNWGDAALKAFYNRCEQLQKTHA